MATIYLFPFNGGRKGRSRSVLLLYDNATAHVPICSRATHGKVKIASHPAYSSEPAPAMLLPYPSFEKPLSRRRRTEMMTRGEHYLRGRDKTLLLFTNRVTCSYEMFETRIHVPGNWVEK